MKSERLEARLNPEDRARIEHAANLEGVSVSAFVVGAAVDLAAEVIAGSATTVVPADFFDALAKSLDDPDPAPRLRRAARR